MDTSPLPTAPHPTDEHVGQRLRLRRQMLRLSQDSLARRIGVTFQQVQKYERGRNRISASRLHDIATVLGVSVDWFFSDLPTAVPMEGEPPAVEPIVDDPMNSTEALRVLTAFFRVRDERQRRCVVTLLETMATSYRTAAGA